MRTEVTMSARSRETSTSMKVTHRSAKACMSAMPSRASGGRESQKAPIRSRMVSPPKPSITHSRARFPAMTRSRHTMSQLRPAPSTSSNSAVFA